MSPSPSTGLTGSRPRILVVEDEDSIADLIALYLRREGLEVSRVRDGEAALAVLSTQSPAAVVLDVGLPGIDGTEVCRRMRAAHDWTPILFCTARDDEVDRVLGLELGADDYITKPFSPRELTARVKVALRHAEGPPSGDVVTVGRVSLDRATRRVLADGREIDLTATEFDLLAYLMDHEGRVLTRDQLLTEVWGYASVVGTRTVDVHVAQLRAKLGEASPLRTVRGVGYSVEVGTSR